MHEKKAQTKATHKAQSSKSVGTYGASEFLAILIEKNFLIWEFKEGSRYVAFEFLWVIVSAADVHDILRLEVKHILHVFLYKRITIATNFQVVLL